MARKKSHSVRGTKPWAASQTLLVGAQAWAGTRSARTRLQIHKGTAPASSLLAGIWLPRLPASFDKELPGLEELWEQAGSFHSACCSAAWGKALEQVWKPLQTYKQQHPAAAELLDKEVKMQRSRWKQPELSPTLSLHYLTAPHGKKCPENSPALRRAHYVLLFTGSRGLR